MNDDRTAARALLLVALVAIAAPTAGVAVAAQESPPATPAAYYGQAVVDGEPAPAGTTIAAVVDGETVASIETGAEGRFGGAGAFAEKLSVPEPDGGNGTTVSFTVAGETAAETVAWESGDVRELTLTADDIDGPTALITAPDSARVGAEIALDATGSDAPLGIASYEWSFPDRTISGESVDYTFRSAGRQDVTLTVTDTRGATATATVTVRVTRPDTSEPDSDTDPEPEPEPEPTATPASTETPGESNATLPEVTEEVTINDSDPDSPGSTVRFNRTRSVRSVTFNNNSTSGSVQVREYNETPPDVTRNITEKFARETGDDGGDGGNGSSTVRVVSVADISPTSPDAASSSATVKLTVDRADVDNPENVLVAHKQDNGSWQRLATNVTETGDGTVTVRARTNSFSRFAVVEEQQTATPTPTATATATATPAPTDTVTSTEAVTATDAPTPTVTESADDGSGPDPLLLGVGGLVILAGIALLLWRRRAF